MKKRLVFFVIYYNICKKNTDICLFLKKILHAERGGGEMVLKSRNTMVTSAVLFLLVVILLRFTGGFFEDNIVRVIGSISGGSAENIPLFDFSSVDVSWLNPTNWSMEQFMTGVNGWLHNMIDSVLPAVINTVNLGAVTTIATRAKLFGVVATTAQVTPAAM
jgi:hypothetical protein